MVSGGWWVVMVVVGGVLVSGGWCGDQDSANEVPESSMALEIPRTEALDGTLGQGGKGGTMLAAMCDTTYTRTHVHTCTHHRQPHTQKQRSE